MNDDRRAYVGTVKMSRPTMFATFVMTRAHSGHTLADLRVLVSVARR